jgi:asparagine synthetase B (glutamine-hydrolysing)
MASAWRICENIRDDRRVDGQGADEILAGYTSYYLTYLKVIDSKKIISFKRIKEQNKLGR